jgi:hypothetical protein
VVSVGVIERRFAVAVLTEGSVNVGDGISTVEGVVTRVLPSFRKCQPDGVKA